MNFASDNTAGAHPQILATLARANAGHVPSYGADAVTARAVALLRELFEAPEAVVHFVPTGTAANALALAQLATPLDAVFCTRMAHINTDECNAPEFYTGGAKLKLVPDLDAKIAPGALREAIEGEEDRGFHGARRGPVSITSLTEWGTAYSAAELAAISALCRDYGLKLHLDGARFANAAVGLGLTPAEMSWRAGVDAVSFGGSKNGCLCAEAVIFFDPADAAGFERRRKRAGHTFSKHRALSAQMAGYLEDGLWQRLAAHANAMGQRLLAGLRQIPGISAGMEMPGNLLFADLPRGLHRALRAAGAAYHLMGGREEGPEDGIVTARFVTAWDTAEEEVEAALAALRRG